MDNTEGMLGVVTWELRSSSGELKAQGQSSNLITDTGDTCYGSNGAGGSTITAAAKPSGMQIGTDTTNQAPAKNGVGSHLVSYLAGQAFDSGYPSGTLSAGNGYTITYKTTYGAGVGTTSGNPITEAAIVTGTVTTADGTGANTIARVQLSAITKASTDSLSLSWSHTLKGS